MRLKSALRRGVAAAVIAGIVVSSGIPAYAARWDIANGDITVKAGDAEGKNKVSQGETIDKDDTNTVITGESDKNTVNIDTSKGDVDVTFDDLKIDVSEPADFQERIRRDYPQYEKKIEQLPPQMVNLSLIHISEPTRPY